MPVGNAQEIFTTLIPKRLQDKPDEEMNLYRQILTIAEGKPLGNFVARAKNNMGRPVI